MDNERLDIAKKTELWDQAEDEILVETYTMIQRKVSEIKSEVGREISVKNVESRKTVASERDHYTDSIFGEVKKKLNAYKKTESYVQYLKQSIASAKETLGELTQIYVARPDVETVRNLVDDVSVRQDLRIILGGLIAESDGLTVDYTFDKKLRQERDKFEMMLAAMSNDQK
ncbi:MAG: hypothetical protein E7481_07255 [Ruminococcaceae bacterium]|nr:hypothetical protein [Oscillospiraceae bacterium]